MSSIIAGAAPAYSPDGKSTMMISKYFTTFVPRDVGRMLLLPKYSSSKISRLVIRNARSRPLTPMTTNAFTDETRLDIRLWIDSFVVRNPQSVVKIGSAYDSQVRTRTRNQAHYSKEYFDNDRAEVFQMKFTNDIVGAEAEGYAIEYARSICISVNDRTEKAGSFSRNPKRGDLGFTTEDPGVIYLNPTHYSSRQGFRESYTSYYHKRQNYSADEIDENGRKIPLTYETGRKQHLTYETGREQHLTYETGRRGASHLRDRSRAAYQLSHWRGRSTDLLAHDLKNEVIAKLIASCSRSSHQQ